jgi:hypothetical protein
MSYTFLGRARAEEIAGSKPLNIRWRLDEPMSEYVRYELEAV